MARLSFLLAPALLLIVSSPATAQPMDAIRAQRAIVSADDQLPDKKRIGRVAKVAGGNCAHGSAQHILHANNVMAGLYNTGGLFWRGSGSLYEVPAYSETNALFFTNIWIGGMIAGEIRFAGTTYGPFEFWPGPLDDAGNPPADCEPYDRIFVVSKRDLETVDAGDPPTADIAEWPWELGAPVVDGDGNPDNYDLDNGDRPDVRGHQTAWWVMNDAAGTKAASGSRPIGMEVQVTAFAVSSPDALDNATFYRYRLIYKGVQPLTDAWFGVWSDPDLGDGTDDFVGSDTTLQMGYVYNGRESDAQYGSPPPALGHVILRGPLVDVQGDGVLDENDPRLGMTTFLALQNDTSPQGTAQNLDEYYGFLRGHWRDGTPVTEGGTGYGGSVATRIMFPGDPVRGSYWSELNTDDAGGHNAPSDRTSLTATGPFVMNSGDHQDIVVAIVWSQGTDHLDSVSRLRDDAAVVTEAFNSGAIDEYPVPDRLRAPAVTYSPEEMTVTLGPGESTSRTVTITNSGNAHLRWTLRGVRPTLARFLTTANGAGPLDPPDTGAFSFNNTGFPTPDGRSPSCSNDLMIDYAACNDRPTHQQQTGPARWGINLGNGNGTFEWYVDQSYVRRGNEDRIGSYDFEWRFTGSSLAQRTFEDRAMVEVPFELWNIGVGTPDDPSDDVRLIPLICESLCGAGTEQMVFDTGGNHVVSGGPNDPASDWIYWYNPIDMSPGEAGYQAWADTGDDAQLGGEIFARQVLVSLDGGTAPPYEQPLPEEGTVFRIETVKRWLTLDRSQGRQTGLLPPGASEEIPLLIDAGFTPPGSYDDVLTIDTRDPDRPVIVVPIHLEVGQDPTGVEGSDELPHAYSLDQNYPNPFNPSTRIDFSLPEGAEVRLTVYDALGRKVAVLADGAYAAGTHAVTFQAEELPSGTYFYRLETGPFVEVRRMSYVK